MSTEMTQSIRTQSIRLSIPVTLRFALACLLAIDGGCQLQPVNNPTQNRNPESTPRIASIDTAEQSSDADEDGIPDKAELRLFADRENFRRWFTYIAEMQFYRISPEWNKEQQDCAGLVRFAWRESLRRHDRFWFERMGADYDNVSPDVQAYTLDSNPLGDKLFRRDFGSFKESDLTKDKFSNFADARTLKNYNTRFVSRERDQAQAGDLLFFHRSGFATKFPDHVMIYLGAPQIVADAAEQAGDWVVYHTGNAPSDEGAMRKVLLSVLDRHPDPGWRPVKNNPRFLGFYRLKILEELKDF